MSKDVTLSANVALLRRLFEAVEKRDFDTILECYAEDVEIHEAESLPYGGVYRGHQGARDHAVAWMQVWGPMQSPDEQSYEPTFLEGDDDTVGAVFRHRAFDPSSGDRLDGAEVGVYEIRDGKVVRSQMFHADPASLLSFLERARRGEAR